MIEQSIAKQYGVLPSQQGDLPYSDWAKLVSGLMDDTPLGRVVAVRAERDPETIRRFSPEQKRLRQEWTTFRTKGADPDRQGQMALQKMLAALCGKEVSGI